MRRFTEEEISRKMRESAFRKEDLEIESPVKKHPTHHKHHIKRMCKFCGSPLHGHEKFCSKCGKKL